VNDRSLRSRLARERRWWAGNGFMSKSLDRASVVLEVEKLPRPGDRADRGVKKVHLMPEQSLEQAKKGFGQAVKAAIGDNPMKVYGAENIISVVVSGEKVPDYMGRLFQDDGARRRLGRELLRGAKGVRQRNMTVIEWDEEEAV
jgi:hypothetical protein